MPVVVADVTSAPPPTGPEVDIADGLPTTPANSYYVARSGDALRKYPNVSVYQRSYIVPAGQAKSWSDCQAAAKRLGLKSWIYNKTNKSCSAYVDNNYLMRMRDPAQIDTTQVKNYIVGCTDSGAKLGDGCEDWISGDRVRGAGGASRKTLLEPAQQGISLEECIAKGKSQGKDAVFYFTNNVTDQRYAATCYEITDTDNLVGFTGNPNDWKHVQACTDPSKKIINGCQ